MKSFYVLFNGHTYLQSLEKFDLYEDVYWHPSIVAAHRFESLCQALEFNESSGLQLEVLRVDITSVYTPDLKAQVVIMESGGSQYLEKMMAHNHSAYLTPQKDDAMVFDDRDQAITFLRKCGHDVANWIIKPK
jgi:hypothetical protein